MPPQFLYFDMGNVLLRFSHEKAAEQAARVAGIQPARAKQILFDDGLHWAYERGDLSRDEFCARFCELAGVTADAEALDVACSDIFELNVPIVALVGRLNAAGYRLGVLSNTSPSHWAHCTRRFTLLTDLFPVHALSFRLRSLKPEPAIYAAAAALAGVPAERIFFTDDRPENIAAARAAGWDAALYESVASLNAALVARGIVCNY